MGALREPASGAPEPVERLGLLDVALVLLILLMVTLPWSERRAPEARPRAPRAAWPDEPRADERPAADLHGRVGLPGSSSRRPGASGGAQRAVGSVRTSA